MILTKNKLKYENQAFSLLEMMLVIAVIATIAIAAIATLKSRSQTLEVHKAAVQMQQIGEAAENYYHAYNKWPVPASSRATSKQIVTLITNHLLSSGGYMRRPVNGYPAEMSPWGKNFRFASSALANDKNFNVYANFPSKKVAMQVKSLLPNAYLKPGNPKQVVMQVQSPSVTATPDTTTIGMVTLSTGKGSSYAPGGGDTLRTWYNAKINAPDCSKLGPTWHPNIAYSLATTQTNQDVIKNYTTPDKAFAAKSVYLHVVAYENDNYDTGWINYTLPSNRGKNPIHWLLYGFVTRAGAIGSTMDVMVITKCVPYYPFYMNPNYLTEKPKEISSNRLHDLPPGIKDTPWTTHRHRIFTNSAQDGIKYGPKDWISQQH